MSSLSYSTEFGINTFGNLDSAIEKDLNKLTFSIILNSKFRWLVVYRIDIAILVDLICLKN